MSRVEILLVSLLVLAGVLFVGALALRLPAQRRKRDARCWIIVVVGAPVLFLLLQSAVWLGGPVLGILLAQAVIIALIVREFRRARRQSDE